MELFYDLIFVAAIIQLGDTLSTQVTQQHAVAAPFAWFFALFIPLWVAWTGYTFFANRFTLDDASQLKRDLYFFFMEGSWTRLFFALGFLYVMVNALIAGLFLLEPGSIGGTDPATFLDAFAFSVQTMSTIGYGVMSPATEYGDLIVALEAAVGILGVALATGIMFAKASRPQPSVLFSEPVIITEWKGTPTLMFRAGNARGNEDVEAEVKVSVLRDRISDEGHHMRRMHDLELVRTRSPFFTLSWQIMHRITEGQPPLRRGLRLPEL